MNRRTAAACRLSAVEPLESRWLLSTYYVSSSGADSNAGTSDAAAFRTLQKAANLVTAGDVVVVRPGTYAGFRRLGVPGGTAAAPITFSADPGVLLNAKASGAASGEGIINIENSGVADGYYVIEGFTVDGSNTPGRGIRSAGSRNNVIRNNVVRDAEDTNIFVSRSDRVVVEGNETYNARGQHGIYVNGSADYVIRGNLTYGNNWNGIHTNVSDGVNQVNSGGLIENNVVRNNVLAGMDLTGMNNGTLRNNLSYGNGRHAVVFQNTNGNATIGCHNMTVVNNTFDARAGSSAWAIQISSIASQPGGTGVSGNDQGVVIFNNILIGNSGSGNGAIGNLSGTTHSTFRSDHNVVVDAFRTGSTQRTFASWRTATGQDANSVVSSATALFVDAAAGNYRLKAGSPALNMAVATFAGQNAPVADSFGGSRPQGGAIDAGYHELPVGGGSDATPPVISSVASTGVGSSSATISWATDEGADTQVEYGTTASYGSTTTLNSTLVINHVAGLTGLSASTVYHYRVRSRDLAGNLSISADFTFTTGAAADTTPPAVSGIGSSAITATAATVSWTTNEASDTQVEYGLSTAYGSTTTLNISMVTSHVATLSGLTAGTLYHYRVSSRDAAGNLTVSADRTFTTAAPPDTTAPTISGVTSASTSSTAATVSWATNEASDTQVEYGVTAAYGSTTTLNATRVTTHGAGITGLAANTTYHYRVLSRDAAGNLAMSADLTFTTLEVDDTIAPVVSGIAASGVTHNAASIAWTTNEAADSQVEFGPTTAYGSTTTLSAVLSIGHAQALTGLTPGTLYHYRVLSRDSAGNLAVSADGTFSTSAAPIPDTTAPTASLSASPVNTGGGEDYTFTVTFNDNAGIDVSTLGNGDVRITGPGGFAQQATFVGVDVDSDGRPRVATYFITAPGGAWSSSRNGTYTVAMRATQVADTSGNMVASGILGTFLVAIAATRSDTAAPTASATLAAAVAGGTDYTFDVTYADNVALDAASIDGNDVLVTGPAGFSQLATLVGVQGIGANRTATYRLSAPGGMWNWVDGGNYTVTLAGNQVRDAAGNWVGETNLGGFDCTAAAVGSFGMVNSRNARFTFTDADGTIVTALLGGGGTAQTYMEGGLVGLELNGTTAKSSLVLIAKRGTGDSRISLGDVRVNGLLRGVIAAAADLAGTFWAAGPVDRIAFGRILNGGALDAVGSRLSFVDADGTVVTAVVGGGGVVEATLNGDVVDLDVNGTGARSSLVVLAKRGTGDSRVALGDVRVNGALRAMVAPAADLRGTMAVAGPLGVAIIGNIAGGTLAASGGILVVRVRGNIDNGRLLAGLNLGGDGHVGGGDDTLGAAVIAKVRVLGSVTGSVFAAGVGPGANGTFGDGDDVFAGAPSGFISISTRGDVDDTTRFESGTFGKAQLGRFRVDPALDTRFGTLA